MVLTTFGQRRAPSGGRTVVDSLLGQSLRCGDGRIPSVPVRARRRERTTAMAPMAIKSRALEASPGTLMPVAARVPAAAAVVMIVEAQAWPGLSVQGSVMTVGPAPGGAVTVIRLVSVPVALGPTVPTRVKVAVAPGDTEG